MQVKNPLEGLPRQISSAIGDIRRIADGMQALPELVRILDAIEKRTESLDQEVKLMRADVNRIGERTEGLERLPEKLDEVAAALHPLRRTLSRFGRGNGEPEEQG